MKLCILPNPPSPHRISVQKQSIKTEIQTVPIQWGVEIMPSRGHTRGATGELVLLSEVLASTLAVWMGSYVKKINQPEISVFVHIS